MKNVLYSILILAQVSLMSACSTGNSETKAKFIIVNRSGSDIDSIRIEPDNDKREMRVKNSDSIDYYSNMTNLPKVDGLYSFRFRNINSQIKQVFGFGYFTNGYPLEDFTRITVFADTILVKPYFSNY